MLRMTKIREQRGWSRSELARRAKLQLSDISKIESGRLRPYDRQLKRIARALDVPQESAQELLVQLETGE